MERDRKRQQQPIAPADQPRIQRRTEKPDLTTQQAARADQQAARQSHYASFIQRFATTSEAQLATQILSSPDSSTEQHSTEQRSAARALPGAGRIRLQRLLQSPHVAGNLSLNREMLNPVRRASDQTVTDLTGLPLQRAAAPTLGLESRLQRHRDTKLSARSAPLNHEARVASPQRAQLRVQRANDGQNQLTYADSRLSQSTQRSPAHTSSVTEHIATAQTARVQRQRVVNARAGELKSQMLGTQLQRLRAPDAPSLEGNGRAYTLTGQADRINTELPIIRAKHNHDPAYLDGDTKPVTDFSRHVGLSLGRQYHMQRTRNGARPSDLSAVISRVHDAHDRANLLTSTLTTFHPNDREAASVQRLVAERENELELQRLALETDLEPVTQRLAEREAEQPENLSAMIARAGGGEELPEKVKRQLQPQFNFSLDIVRIHRDGYADQLAKTVNAVAFTTGASIFFRSGKFDPSSASGRGLLVHELTHVGQQLAGRAKAGLDADQGLEDQAASAGVKEEGKGALPEAAARDAVESGVGSLGGQQVMGGLSALQRKNNGTATEQHPLSTSASLTSSPFRQVESSLTMGVPNGKTVQRLEGDDDLVSKPFTIEGSLPSKLFGKFVELTYKAVIKKKGKNGIASSGFAATDVGVKVSASKVKDKIVNELKISLLKIPTNGIVIFGGKKIVFYATFGEITVSIDKLDSNQLIESIKKFASKFALAQVKGSIEDADFIKGFKVSVEVAAKVPLESLLDNRLSSEIVKEIAESYGDDVGKLWAKQLDLLDEAEKIAKEIEKIDREVKRLNKFNKLNKILKPRAIKTATKVTNFLLKRKNLLKSLELIEKGLTESKSLVSQLTASTRSLIAAEKPLLQKLLVRAIDTQLGKIVARLAPRALLILGKALSVVGWVLLIADLVQAANGLLLWLAGHRKFKFLAGDGSVGYFDFITESFEPEKHKFKEGDSDEPSGERTGAAPNSQNETDATSGENNTTQKDRDSSNQGSLEQQSQPRAEQVLQDSAQLRLLSFMTSRTGDNKLTGNQYIQLLSIISAYELNEKTLETVIQQLSSGTLSSPEQAISALQQILAKFGVPKTTAGQENQTSANGSSERTPSSTVSSGNVSDETKPKRKKPRVKKKTSTGQGAGGTPTKQRISGDDSSRLVPYSGEVSGEKTTVVSSLSSYTTNKQGTLITGKCVLVLYNRESKSRLRLKATVIQVRPNYVQVQTEITTPMLWKKGEKSITVLQPNQYGILTLKRVR